MIRRLVRRGVHAQWCDVVKLRSLTLTARCCAVFLVACSVVAAPVTARAAQPWRKVEKVATERGIVVCASPAAADVGVELLRRGGNAVDAAVGVALAMAVTFPEAGNIGGGGFMMVRPADGSEPTCFEYRETAPAVCKADTFVKDTAMTGHRVVGVPGTIRGLELAHKKYGKLPWRDVVMPAVKLAREGFSVDRVLAADLNRLVAGGAKFPEFVEVFGKARRKKRARRPAALCKRKPAPLRRSRP
ncbi:MAG: gamma-glutamyltransferase [Pirellulales bacterium]